MTENKNKIRKRKRKPYSSISITTGDIGLNINHFNRAFGTADSSNDSEGAGGTMLSEAKRYVRRYYIRPQNRFASNKAEIIKILIELGNQNCSIYTLNNLGDDKDVTKLMNSDIIYYYDDGILYDKNHVKIMDYDLSIKKEEERKHFTNVDKTPEKEFKAEYEDRMTKATELDEDLEDTLLATCPYDIISANYNHTGNKFIVSLNNNVEDIETVAKVLGTWVENTYDVSIIDWNTNGLNVFIFELSPDNVFALDFEDINGFGEKLTESKERLCNKCGEPIDDAGHETPAGIICDGCYLHFSVGG